jgi:uncharacterized membrane protein
MSDTQTVAPEAAPQPPAKPAHEDKVLPVITYVLYLIGLTHGLTILIGVIIAYVARDGAGPVARSHYDFLIRTFWPALIGVLVAGAAMVVGVVLSLVLIGFPILFAAGALFLAIWVWVMVRCIVGLIYLSRGEAHPRPATWLA